MSEPRLPQDSSVDRRSFLHRMGVLTAVAATGVPLPVAAVERPRTAGTPGLKDDAFWGSAVRDAEARMPWEEPAELTAWEAGVAIRQGGLSVSALVEACVARVQRFDPLFKAFNDRMDEEVRRSAAAFDQALSRDGIRQSTAGRPLFGIPVAIKDNVYVAGVRTTANSHIFRDFRPEWDATLVTRIREAGGLPFGKTQMGPLATTRATTPDGQVTTVNAWAPFTPSVSPGGSSSGSATAVAGRLVPVAMGTQTGGSITAPALAQGLTGLKPTMGRVSLRGIIPLTYTRDHPGPLARDARDAALLLQAMAGPDPEDPRTLGLPPVPDYLTAATPVESAGGWVARWPTRLGVPTGWADGDTPRGVSRRRFLQTMEAGGIEVVEVNPSPRWTELSSGLFNAARLPERTEPFLEWLREDVRLFGVTLGSWIQGLFLSGDEYLKAQRARYALLSLTLDEVFSRCDVVVQGNHVPFDMIGLPLLAFPVGEGAGGIPDGIMLGGAPFGEERLLAVAALWQAQSDLHLRRPEDPVFPESGEVQAHAAGAGPVLTLEEIASTSA
jgi:Asp-tRNA(Asn)/Glu-tRNA(Gln) amidotransferase A subunit family amidase